ncbi:hypothetical protein MBLNU459_g1932t1 [Dothideomycetes sp. NU459]
MADTINNASGVDAAKIPLGGRKAGDATAKDLEKMSPEQQLATVQKAKEEGANESEPSSLKIKIHLDLDVEVHLTARIKGDIVIGLL